jgi:GntR family transcriptional regulator
LTARMEMIRYLRDRIIGELHVGHLKSGDRLPSVRDVAALMKKNPRTVRAAYRALELEGLVKVRGRSGVFVESHEIVDSGSAQEMTRWVASVVTEAWKRRIPAHQVGQFIEQCATASKVRCGLVEVVEDAKVALAYELEKEWGFDVRIVAPGALARNPTRFREFDFFACTSFYAPLIHTAVEALGKRLVVITAHVRLQDAIRARLEKGRLTVVAADPRFGERIRIAYASEHPHGEVRLILASDANAVRALDPDEPVLFTRAAREQIGAIKPPMIFAHSPTISVDTASTLAGLIVRRNMRVPV